MAIDDRLNAIALATAKEHVQTVCALGSEITLIKPGVTDEMGEILTESTQVLHTFPVRVSPFTREITSKISWAEDVSAIFYVAMKEIDELLLTTANIKQYIKLRHIDKEYEIAYVDNYSSFGTSFLYLIIGAKL